MHCGALPWGRACLLAAAKEKNRLSGQFAAEGKETGLTRPRMQPLEEGNWP